jgi:hypothetical protein
MITQTKKHLQQSMVYALVASTTIVSMVFLGFFVAEPSISHGQAATEEFTISQVITGESSFNVAPADVNMQGSINGLTGGNATGTSQFSVLSNNAAGYYVEIAFFDNLTDEAMQGEDSGSESIRDYDGDVAGEPGRGFTASTAAQFAYTVTSSSTTDTDPSFFHQVGAGDNCGITGTSQVDGCWKAPDTAGFRIVDTSQAALTGATSTITFKVNVPNAPVPVLQAETYTATATLSLFVK